MKVDLCYADIREDHLPFYKDPKQDVSHMGGRRKKSKQKWLLKCYQFNPFSKFFRISWNINTQLMREERGSRKRAAVLFFL